MAERSGGLAARRAWPLATAPRGREGVDRDALAARGWDLYLVAAAALLPIVVPSGPAGATILDGLNAVALAAFLVVAVRTRAPVRFLFALPMLLIATRSLLAVSNAVSVSAGFVSLLLDAYLYLWFVALVALMGRRRDLASVRRAWVAAACAVAIGTVGAAVARGELSVHHLLAARGPRLSGTFPNVNVFADYLVFSMFMTLSLAGRLRAPLLAAALAVLLLALVATKSNGGLMSLAAGLAVWLPARAWYAGEAGPRVAGRVALALAGILLVAWAVSESRAGGGLFRRIQEESLLARISHSSESRQDIWRPLERNYRRSPLGIGPGNSAHQTVPIGERERPDSFRSKEAHNDYLAYAVERGLLALFGLLLWTGQVFRMVLGARGRPGPDAERLGRAVVLASFLGALVATSLHSLVIEKLHFRHFWMFLGVVCAMTGAVRAAEPAAADPRAVPRRFFAPRWGGLAMRGGNPT